jgi:hypothetical protein
MEPDLVHADSSEGAVVIRELGFRVGSRPAAIGAATISDFRCAVLFDDRGSADARRVLSWSRRR